MILVAAAALFGVSAYVWFRWRYPSPEALPDAEKGALTYDWNASRANLVRIGQALQLYRSDYPPKVVRARRTRADAGLPPFLEVLDARHYPNNSPPWTVSKEFWFVNSRFYVGRSDQSQVSGFRYGTYYLLVGDGIELSLSAPELKDYWSQRGENVPIMLDLNMYTSAELSGSKRPLPVLVLRLDGRAEETQFVPYDYRDLYLNR